MARALDASQARRLLAAEVAWRDAKAKLKEAEERRNELRARYRPSLRRGETLLAGIRILISVSSTGQTFQLKGYLQEGNEITEAMAPFVSEPREYERWSVLA